MFYLSQLLRTQTSFCIRLHNFTQTRTTLFTYYGELWSVTPVALVWNYSWAIWIHCMAWVHALIAFCFDRKFIDRLKTTFPLNHVAFARPNETKEQSLHASCPSWICVHYSFVFCLFNFFYFWFRTTFIHQNPMYIPNEMNALFVLCVLCR